MCIWNAMCRSNARLDDKTVLITGANSGIGKVTAEDLYKRGGRIILACRDCRRGQIAADEIEKSCQGIENVGELTVIELDLASLASVRKCAKQILQNEPKLNILINNAGVMACPRGKTKDGFETQLGTNHLGHFLLTLLLLPKLNESKPSRIINLTSRAHLAAYLDFKDLNYETKKHYSPYYAYAQSKLACLFFTQELAKRLKDNKIEGITVYAVHPGVINTELGRNLNDSYICGLTTFFNVVSWFIKSPEQGAQTTIYCAVDEHCANESGKYYHECTEVSVYWNANNPEAARKLFDASLKLVGLGEHYNPFNFGAVAPLFITRTVGLDLANIPIT